MADVFLLASLSEGISNAVLEAMACGITVVTTNCGGMAEAVTDGIEGFVVPVRDPCSMAHRLEKLATDRELCRRMGLAARDRIVREFTLTRQAESFVSLYSHLCGNPATRVAERAAAF
jgi:glycosyltransferase involved in cell wall biosynthesis